MKSYYRIMLGKQSVHADECFNNAFIGADFDVHQDLSHELTNDLQTFNKRFIPEYLAEQSGKSKVSAGLAGGALWTVSKGLQIGDIVLCPDGKGTYRTGEICGDYYYAEGDVLQHRRPVRWLAVSIDRSTMSEALRNSTGSIGTVSNITQHSAEIERFMSSADIPKLITTDASIEDPASFAMEEHLEAFLVSNWNQTELGKEYDIYEEDGEKARQYRTDTGPLDILAISKDKKTLLVVELKKGRSSDAVVGQTLRYMGYVKEELAEEGQLVLGAIVALEEDKKLRRALTMIPSITFYQYKISFKLVKSEK